MKKICFILFALVMSANIVSAQNEAQTKNGPKAEFESIEHNFGKVKESVGSVTCDFKFKNTGTEPIIIQRVQTTCGCTTPDYTKEPVLPGKEGVIKVTFTTTGRIGSFYKGITIFTNVPDEVYTVKIKGEVIQ